jgi:hypothetical protein
MKLTAMMKRIARQLFTVAPAWFFWGCLVSLLGLVFAWLYATALVGLLTLTYQLLGTFIALFAIVEQRKAMSVESLWAVLRDWLRSFRPRVHNVSADLTGQYATMSGAAVVIQKRPASDTATDKQLQMLWDAIDRLEKDMGKLQNGLDKHQRATERELGAVQARFAEDIKHAEKRLVNALTSGPLWVFFGFWLLTISTLAQLLEKAREVCPH